MSKKKTLFEKIWEGSKEALKAMKKPIVKRKLVRDFNQAFDDAEKVKGEAELKIQNLREDIENYDVKKIMKHRQEIISAELTQKEIMKEYELFFGKKMNVEYDD